MKKWTLAIVLCLAICLMAYFAVADGTSGTNMVLPDEDEVTVTTPDVSGNTRIIPFGEQATVLTPVGQNISKIQLTVKDTSTWKTVAKVTHDTSDPSIANGELSFVFNVAAIESGDFSPGFQMGHLYLAELMAIPAGAENDSTQWEGFWGEVLTVVSPDDTSSSSGGLQLYLNRTLTDNHCNAEIGCAALYVTAYDSNAQNVWIELDGEAFQGRNDSKSMTICIRYDELGEHTVRAVSMDTNGNRKTSDTKTFSMVRETNYQLYPGVTNPVTYTIGNTTKGLELLPETIPAGTDISYTIQRVTQALGTDAAGLQQQVRYDSWLDDLTDEDGSIELPSYRRRLEQDVANGLLLPDSESSRTITIHGNELQSGHTYRLYVEITSSGCTPVIYSKTFVVLPTQMDTQHTITLSFRDEAGDSTLNIQQYKQFKLHASAPGAKVVRFWSGEGFEYLNTWVGGEWTGEFDFDWKTWGKGEYKYFIQAYYGELNETPWDQMDWDPACISNILTVNAIQDVPDRKVVPIYTTTLPSNNIVTQGDYFTVTLGNTEEELSHPDVYFGASLYNGENIDTYYEPKGKKFTIPTADLEPGCYTLAIYTETNGAGYIQIPYYFKVVAPATVPEHGFMITTTASKDNGKYTVESYEDFGVTFYAPEMQGYDRYYQFFDGQDWWWENWDDRSVTLDVDLDPGTWEVYAKVVYVSKSDPNVEISYESAHLPFTASSNGSSGITLSAPGSYTVAENSTGYTVTLVNESEIAPERYADEYWELQLRDTSDGRNEIGYVSYQDGSIKSSYTFPKDFFTAGRSYRLYFRLNVRGYDPVEEEINFAALSPSSTQQGTLSLGVYDKEFDAPITSTIMANKEISVKVDKSDNITAVRVLNGDHWEVWCGNDNYQRDWRFGSGVIGFVAQGTTDEAVWEARDFNWENFDWDRDVHWTVTSNTVTIKFTTPNGKNGRPTLTLDKAGENPVYTRGEVITATVGKVANAEWYNLKVLPIDEYGNEDWSRKTELYTETTGTGTFTFLVRTDHMDPGMYRIWVDNSAIGYSDNGSNPIEFEIKQGSNDPQAVLEFQGATIDPETGKASINTNTNIEIYAFVPGASDIWLKIEKENNDGWYNDRNNGERYAFWEFGEAFKGTYIFKLYGHVDGHDEETPFVTKTLQVKADNGDLTKATITLSDNVITVPQAGDSWEISGSFVRDARSEWYEIRLVYRGPDGSWDDDEIRSYYRNGANISNSFAFDISDFKRVGVYEVQVIGGATGYNGTDVRKRIIVTNAANQNLTLSINGDSASTTKQILSSDSFNVKVTFTERPTAVRVLSGNRFEYWWGDEEDFERDWCFGDGEQPIYAEATWDNIDFDEIGRNDWANFDWDEDVHWTGRSNAIILSIVSPYGEMVAPTFTIGNAADEQGNIVIPWGEDLIINIVDAGPYVIDPEAQSGKSIVKDGWFNFNLEVERSNENGKWWDRVDGNYHVQSGVNHIMTYNLEDGCRYRAEVGADGRGYNGKSSSIEFTLARKTSQEETKIFTVNGSTDNITVASMTELILSAYHPDAYQCKVVITEEGNNGWQEEKNDSRNGLLMDRWRSNHAGVFTLTAYGCMEGGDDLIGSVQVTVTADKGDLEPLQATITDANNKTTEKAYVGNPLTVNFTAVTVEGLDPDDVEYSYWIHSDDDNRNLLNNKRHGAGALTIETGKLEPGVYWVELDAMAAGYNQSHKTLYFVLLDENDIDKSGSDYFFTISATELPTEKGAHIIGYMPGANEIQLYYFRNDNTEWENMEDRRGPGISTWIGDGQADTFRIYISGRFGQTWTEPVETCTVTFKAIADLAKPTISINGTKLNETNHVVSADAQKPGTMHVTINKVQNADFYHVEISRHGDNWPVYSENLNATDTEGNTIGFDITDERIEAGYLYKIQCDARAVGYNFSHYENNFLLDGGEATGVSLQVSPDTNDGKFWTGENVRIHVEAEGATGLKVCKSGDVRYFTGSECDFGWNIDDEETCFYAYATNDQIPHGDGFDWDKLNWNRRSELVYIEAQTHGYIPDNEMPALKFNNQVTKGDWFEFTISGGTARQMDIRISDDQWNELEFRQFWTPGVYRIPTANLNPGQYRVTLNCVKDGYLWTRTQDRVLYVNAPAQGQDKAFFKVDKITSDEGVVTLYLYEPFIPSVYAPGAEHIWICNTHDDDIWGDWSGDNGTNHPGWEWWYDELREGGWGLTAWAQYPGSNERVVIGNLTFNVLEPTQLGQPEIQVDDVVDADEPVYIDIPAIQYAGSYTLELHSTTGGGDHLFRWTKMATETKNGKVTFAIPAKTMAPDQSYWLDCSVNPPRNNYAYTENASARNIKTKSGAILNETIHLEMNGNWTIAGGRYQIPVNTHFSVTVSANEASGLPTAVAVYMGDYVMYRFFDEGDGSATSETFGLNEYQPWPETIFARAYYGDLSMYQKYEDVPWQQLAWGPASSETILVNFTSHGQAEPAVIDADWTTMEGDDLIVHVTLGAHANEAHANLDWNTGGMEEHLVFDDWIMWEEDPEKPGTGIIRIPTNGLGTNCFRVYVENSGEGYESARATVWKWIVEDPFQSQSRLVLPSGLTAIEDEAFEGIAAYAVIIPNGVTTIGRRAFADSNVKLVVIPASVTTIGEGAFSGCDLLIVYGYEGDGGVSWRCAEDYNAKGYYIFGD